MGYIDILIPLLAGILFLTLPEKLLKPTDTNFKKKKSLISKCGYVLIGISVLYFLIKTFA